MKYCISVLLFLFLFSSCGTAEKHIGTIAEYGGFLVLKIIAAIR
jgi:hypothetical protein